jgi:hypothetical protein
MNAGASAIPASKANQREKVSETTLTCEPLG